jgi:hypothetical protein
VTKPLDELYLEWLYPQVASARLKNPARTHWKLIRKLYTTEFVWFVPNDDNRVEDGRDLRYEFIDACGIQDVDPAWLNLGCSMLEMFIGLSRRLSFQGEGEPRDWFWHMMTNLDLYVHNDKGVFPDDRVTDILNAIVWRTYEPDGRGGVFPLRHAEHDQRDVELWYQLCAYLVERS